MVKGMLKGGEQAGLDYEATRVYGSVANAFELLIRINNLTFKHHQIAMAAARN